VADAYHQLVPGFVVCLDGADGAFEVVMQDQGWTCVFIGEKPIRAADCTLDSIERPVYVLVDRCRSRGTYILQGKGCEADVSSALRTVHVIAPAEDSGLHDLAKRDYVSEWVPAEVSR
jgi:hypothetical protein